jgi:UDP-4-amino-4,6-dideoxy-N-acetyl-beta-L-altrosamine N-acetyltransferase
MHDVCTIRPVTQVDLDMILRWRNHPSVRSFMLTQHEISPDEHAQWFASASTDSHQHLLIVEDATVPIGYVQFKNVSINGVSEWGFYTSPDAPKGSGKKLGKAALSYAFETLKLHKVVGQAFEFNLASMRFHEHLGFKHEGLLREHYLSEGRYHSLVCYGLLRREWELSPCNTEKTDDQN